VSVQGEIRPTKTTSREAGDLLDSKLEDLRFRVMRLSSEFAREDGTEVTIKHVDRALEQIAQSGSLDYPVSTTRPIGRFPEQVRQYLARRLVSLHIVLTGWATKYAKDAQARPDEPIVIMNEHIEQGWKKIGTREQLSAVLLQGKVNAA